MIFNTPSTLPYSLVYKSLEEYLVQERPCPFIWWYADGWITIKPLTDSEADGEAIELWVREEVERLEMGVEANFYQE